MSCKWIGNYQYIYFETEQASKIAININLKKTHEIYAKN